MEFEWDGDKEQANIEKRGIDFAEAATVFGDPFESRAKARPYRGGMHSHAGIGAHSLVKVMSA